MIAAALLLAVLAKPSPQDGYPTLSPFEAVRWNELAPEVQVGATWYRLLAIDGVDIDEVLAFATTTWPDLSVKRFEEDLVEVMTRMGHPPAPAHDPVSTLRVVDLATEKETELRDVRWTGANRRRIWEAANRSRRPEALGTSAVHRVERDHATQPAQEFGALARWLPVTSGRPLTRAQIEEDLDQLEWLVEHRFAYRDLAGIDWRAAFDAVRLDARDGTTSDAVALQLAQLLARFGDGHTRVRGRAAWTPPGYLPVALATEGERVLALGADGTTLTDPAHPVLVAIDGAPLAQWIAVAERFAVAGSPRARRNAALEWTAATALLRAALGRRAADTVELTLASADGVSTVVRTLPLAPAPAFVAPPPDSVPRRLDGDLGYLRIASMDDEPAFLDALDAAMESFRDTRGLVIDVRGNGGGSRAALWRLLPYFLADERPVVVNVAAPRIEGGGARANTPEELLADRGLYRANAARWDDAARDAIRRWERSVELEWELDPSMFGPLHYALVARADNPRAFHYDRPVALLHDGGCFSATDVFLGAFAELPAATLVGTPTGGGSGRPRGATLAHSRLEVLLSSMASFRPNGAMYDRRGVEPDVWVEPSIEDRARGRDAVLERACEILRAAR